MSLFIRQQLSQYCLFVWETRSFRGHTYEAEMVYPAIRYSALTPHGRNANTGSPSDWGPDLYGYTDFDDYHLALYGA